MRTCIKWIGVALAAPLLLLAIAACGSGGGSSSSSTPTTETGGGTGSGQTASSGKLPKGCGQLTATNPTDDPDGVYAKVIKPLGPEVAAGYQGYAAPLMRTPYESWKAKPGPWTVGYSDSFSGNAWRAAAKAAMEANFDAAKEQGVVGGDLIVTDSNLKTEVQIQQMRSMIQHHVSIIFSIPGSPTALNGVIKEAYDAGIPVLTLNSPVTSPYAINVEVNEFLAGARQAQGLVYVLGGKGDIMTVQGLSGAPASTQIEGGGTAIFETCPEIDVVDSFDGEWNDASAKTAMLQALSTNPGDINGVWEQGSMTKGIIEAFEQQGREVPPVTAGNPNQSAIGYWQEHKAEGYPPVGSTSPSTAGADAMFRIGMRVLEGKGPKVNAFVGDPPIILSDDAVKGAEAAFPGVDVQGLSEWENPEWTFSSPGVANPPSGPNGSWLNDQLLDKLFNQPGSKYKGISEAGIE